MGGAAWFIKSVCNHPLQFTVVEKDRHGICLGGDDDHDIPGISRPPQVIRQRSADGMRKTILRAKQVDCAGIAIPIRIDPCNRALPRRQSIIYSGNGLYHLIRPNATGENRWISPGEIELPQGLVEDLKVAGIGFHLICWQDRQVERQGNNSYDQQVSYGKDFPRVFPSAIWQAPLPGTPHRLPVAV